MRNFVCILLALTATFPVSSAIARDQIGHRGWGPRFGVTAHPGQVHVGLHLDSGSFAERFRLQPNMELGMSDGLTLFCLNGEFVYPFGARWDSWSPYLGGGIGLNLRMDDRGSRRNHSDADLGASVLGGIEKRIAGGDRFFIETKLGLVDAPDLKITVGWTFF